MFVFLCVQQVSWKPFFCGQKTGCKGHLLKFSSKWKINKILVSSCEHILYKVLWVLQAHLPSSKKWWQAISHVALCNETPWGREQCLLGNYTISQNSSQVRLFMKYIASETEESQNRILFTSKVIPARKQTCFQKKKQMEYQKASPESRQVWSSGKTLLDLPWSNGNDQWPMAIFGHAQHAMVLHLCRAKCSLIQVFVTCGSSFRCLYGFTYAKIRTLPVIWEKTCFVSSTFVPIRKIIEKC